MILVDTSAWIDFIRATGSPTDEALVRLVEVPQDVATSEPIMMELLAGSRGEQERRRLRRMLASCSFVAVDGLDDYEQAARVFRRCRVRGETVRSLVDCLIAAVALRADLEVLHHDRDFDVIARHVPLRLAAT